MEKNNQDNSINQYQQIAEIVTKEIMKFLSIGMLDRQEYDKKLITLAQAVQDLKNELAKNIHSTNKDTIANLGKSLGNSETTLKKIMADGQNTSLATISALAKKLGEEIARVESIIPPKPDFSPVWEKINNLKLLTLDDVEKALPQFGAASRDGLELLQGDERLDKKAIRGLDEEFKRIEGKIPTIMGGNGGSGRGVMFYDLSSQTTGSLKIFTVPKGKNAIILGQDFPSVLMEGNGFTLNATRTQATLTTANAPSSGSQLLFQYTPLFNT